MPSAGLLIRFYDGIHEDDSATTVHITDGHPWQPVAELVEQARRSNLFLHEPFAIGARPGSRGITR